MVVKKYTMCLNDTRKKFAFNLAMPFLGSLLTMEENLRVRGCLRSIDE